MSFDPVLHAAAETLRHRCDAIEFRGALAMMDARLEVGVTQDLVRLDLLLSVPSAESTSRDPIRLCLGRAFDPFMVKHDPDECIRMVVRALWLHELEEGVRWREGGFVFLPDGGHPHPERQR